MPRKQKDLPGIKGKGVAPVQIKEIDDAAEEYVKHRDKRQAATRKEVDAKKDLIAALHKHEKKIGRNPKGAIIYEYDGNIVTLAPTDEKLKVKHKASDSEDEDLDVK